MITRNVGTKSQSFEEWLMERHILEENPLDDMLPDSFNDWIEYLDIDDIFKYADMYVKDEVNRAENRRNL